MARGRGAPPSVQESRYSVFRSSGNPGIHTQPACNARPGRSTTTGGRPDTHHYLRVCRSDIT